MFRIKVYHPVFTALLIAFSLLLLTEMSSCAQSLHGQIDRADARSLVIATIQSMGYDTNSPKMSIEEEKDPYFPNFYHFGVYFDTPDRLATVGFFAVDPKTADVWEKGLCQLVKAMKVQEIQKALRLRYQIDEKQTTTVPPCQHEE